MSRLKPLKGSGAKQKGKRGRINANKVKGRIHHGGPNVGKKGVVGSVGGKDVVNRKPKKKKPANPLPAPRPEKPRKLPKGPKGKGSNLLVGDDNSLTLLGDKSKVRKRKPVPLAAKTRKKAPAKKRPRKKV